MQQSHDGIVARTRREINREAAAELRVSYACREAYEGDNGEKWEAPVAHSALFNGKTPPLHLSEKENALTGARRFLPVLALLRIMCEYTYKIIIIH